MLSDASSEDWATIGVKVLSIALIPQAGGGNVTVYTAPSPAPMVNLVELDQISDILGSATIPAGTYTGAIMTVSGNSSDILLTVATDPEAGFAGTPGATIPSSQIQVQHTSGSGTDLSVPVKINFVSPLTVSPTQNNALNLEFDLGHPAFIIGHVPPASGGETLWAVNFDGPVRHHPVHDLRRLVLRHTYGDVTQVTTSTLTITKQFPTEPVVSPETAVAGSASLNIQADSTNGTIFYDMDAKTRTVITDFSSETDLNGKYVRIAARYQEDGTLVATRIWASTDFNTVWVSPEGHVLHVNPNTDFITVENDSGHPVPLLVNSATEFFFRNPSNPAADSKSIATGTAFLSSKNIVRGFKVHASVVDPLATPLVAQSIDIETAEYSGAISQPNATSFTYTHDFHTATDDYVYSLDYISDSTANGADADGNAISGYKWWNFAYPTVLYSGTTAIDDFVSATNGSVGFGGAVGDVPSYAVSYETWNDPSNPLGWAAADTILLPSRLPRATVTAALANNEFSMSVSGGTMAVTVDVSTTAGSATLVYQVDRTDGVVTVSPIDITTAAGLQSLTDGLATGAPVQVYGSPQANAAVKAYVIMYFTGEMPSN
jgi:hypothetical protein